MTRLFRHCAIAVLVAGIGAGASFAEGPTLVTVTGNIAKTDRGAFDESYDKLFAFNDVAFDKAMAFDISELQGLPQHTVKTDFPKGGDMVTFTGPALADVLAAAGADGKIVTIRAMDGYAVDMPLEEAVEKGAVVALTRNGDALGIGDFGPTQIVFPRAERADLADMPDDWWIWQIYHIAVE